MSSSRSQATAWRIASMLAILAVGLAIGDERPEESSQYFWDLSSYVTALSATNYYDWAADLPFLYPPAAADIFKLARTHLFELMSIAYVAAVMFFLVVYSRLTIAWRFEWLFAITALGGMGVVALKTGNVAIAMNFTLLALMLDAAMGSARSLLLLPIAIAAGALIKPQFVLYVGLLPVLVRPLRSAATRMGGAAFAAVGIHISYVVFRPSEWSDYIAIVNNRIMTEKDFGWGSAALFMHIANSNTVAFAGFAVVLLCVAALSYIAWQKAVRSGAHVPLVSAACLAFVVLTFANPRMPLYDLYAAGIAVTICCGVAGRSLNSWAMVVALAVGLVPWLVKEFTKSPVAWPWWTRDYLVAHMAGMAVLLIALARTGLAPEAAPRN